MGDGHGLDAFGEFRSPTVDNGRSKEEQRTGNGGRA